MVHRHHGVYHLPKHGQRRYEEITKHIENATFPVPPYTYTWTLIAFALLASGGYHPFGQWSLALEVHVIEPIMRYHLLTAMTSVIVSSALAWIGFVCAIRTLIMLSLYYKGYMFDPMGKPSGPTKAFMMLMTMLYKAKPHFFSFQGMLPKRPLPSAKRTVELYLKSIRPLVDDAEYEQVVQKSQDFLNGPATKIQLVLWLKWLVTESYVDDWWKKYAYDSCRDTLLKTSVGGVDFVFMKQKHTQAARAATLTVLTQMYYIDYNHKQHVQPITLGGIPMCSKQYADVYRTIRMPGKDCDVTRQLGDARHMVVHYKGCWYAVPVFDGERLLRPAELEQAIQHIIDHPQTPEPGEAILGALTNAPRTVAWETRQKHFSSGINKESIDMIDSAVQIVFLEDTEDGEIYDPNDSTKLESQYRRMLGGGDGILSWSDYPNTMQVSADGHFRTHGEHSIVDALIYCQIIEYYKYHEAFVPEFGYDDKGHAHGRVDYVPDVQRLKFELNEQVQGVLQQSYADAKKLADDIDNASLIFLEYGKDHMKKIGISPDAYLQMALQLAYHRDQNKFPLTYESALARLHKGGRTETVRSCTLESCNFVRAMDNEGARPEERLAALRNACNAHQTNYKRAMAGDACDRHLFAMYIASKALGVSSPFLCDALGRDWKLSTSQTPQHQQPETLKKLNSKDELFWPAGAFNCPNGSDYGVCYTVGAGGKQLAFHVATWHSLAHTNAHRFREHLLQALRDMYSLTATAVGEPKDKKH